MGAWIETPYAQGSACCAWSLPMWERGLKLPSLVEHTPALPVAPHVGAWIETSATTLRHHLRLVAPHVGAWIETLTVRSLIGIMKSLPMWERGLKLLYCMDCSIKCQSLPMWERGLQHYTCYNGCSHIVSLPIWERGSNLTQRIEELKRA